MEKEENYLRIAQSSIPNIGKGLFTLKEIKEGELICRFEGRLISEEESAEIMYNIENGNDDPGKANYYIALSSGLILDSYASDCLGRYTNDAEGITKGGKFKNNAEIVEGEDGISAYLEATANIPKDGEIFTDYGKEYWQNFTGDL